MSRYIDIIYSMSKISFKSNENLSLDFSALAGLLLVASNED